MPDPTPGQVCYEAYRAWYVTASPLRADIWPEHSELEPDDRAAWEASAQAVLAQAQEGLVLDLDPDIVREDTP